MIISRRQQAITATIVIVLAAVLLSRFHVGSNRSFLTFDDGKSIEELRLAGSIPTSGKEIEQPSSAGVSRTSRTTANPITPQGNESEPRSGDEVATDADAGNASTLIAPSPKVGPLELLDAKSAVGRPFPLSESVMRTCASAVPAKSECPRLMEFLEQFAGEPRDVVWAREMEERLEKAIAFPDPERFSVRAIECRSSRCVLEVAAPFEWYLGELDHDRDLSRHLHGPTVGELGFERGPGGERVIVTVAGFVRQ